MIWERKPRKEFGRTNGMKVVFLCGGIGKRMFPITEDKFLLRFAGKTLLEHQIEMAKEAGLAEFVIVGNPQNIANIERITANIPGIKAELAVQKEHVVWK